MYLECSRNVGEPPHQKNSNSTLTRSARIPCVVIFLVQLPLGVQRNIVVIVAMIAPAANPAAGVMLLAGDWWVLSVVSVGGVVR